MSSSSSLPLWITLLTGFVLLLVTVQGLPETTASDLNANPTSPPVTVFNETKEKTSERSYAVMAKSQPRSIKSNPRVPVHKTYLRKPIVQTVTPRKTTKTPVTKTKKKKVVSNNNKETKVTSEFFNPSAPGGTLSPTSFENKLPFDGKETEENIDSEETDEDDEEGSFSDFFYDEIQELAPPVIEAFTQPPLPPYKLKEDDEDDDDYYDDDEENFNYPSEKDDEDYDDGNSSFTSFFMDLFYELFTRFTGSMRSPDEMDDDEYYDENNYAARRTTPRGLSYRKKLNKRPTYNQFLGFFEEEVNDNKIDRKTKDTDVAESKWLSWFDSAPELETRAGELTTQPMVATTTESSSWGLFNMFGNDEEKAAPTSSSSSAPVATNPSSAPTETTANIPALISALSDRLVATTSAAPPSDLPAPQPSTQKSYKNYQLWRLKPINEDHLNALNGLRLYHSDYQWWQGPSLEGKTDVLVPPNKLDEFREFLDEEEIKHTTTIRNLDMAIRFSNPSIPRSESFQLEAIQGHPMSWHRYHRYADLMKYFEYLHRKYPRNVDLIHIGRTFEGRPIVVCHIFERPPKNEGGSNKRAKKRRKQSIFVEAGVRGHEWIGPAVATWILEDLSRNNFHLTNRTLDGVAMSREWYILPVGNPDGYEYSHTTDRLWTKNRSRKKKTSIGFFSNL